MARPWRISVAVIVLMAAAMQAWSASTWVLWVEAPAGSDQWSIAAMPEPKFVAKEECERRAQALNDFEQFVAKMERMTGDSRDHFSCLPDTVDPRPEGALR